MKVGDYERQIPECRQNILGGLFHLNMYCMKYRGGNSHRHRFDCLLYIPARGHVAPEAILLVAGHELLDKPLL